MAGQGVTARQPVFCAFAGWRALVTTFLLGSLVACGGGGGGGGGSGEADSVSAVAPVASETPITPITPITPTTPPTTSGVPAGYQLVWSDEFDQPGLPDATRWDYDTDRNRLGWYNNERQYYARDRAENAVVSGGQLLITARKESLSSAADWGGQAYTSARLLTRGKAAWTYGFFEVRAKLPCGVGTWPAIWTLGTGGRWPQDGEIDIMEQVGSNPSRVFGTVHTQSGFAGNSRSGALQITDACTAFHNYQMTWTADAIEFAVDGVTYHRYPNPRSGVAAWPFDAPQYLLLNIAIGGDLGGPVDDRIFPVTMVIEHVRIYRKTP